MDDFEVVTEFFDKAARLLKEVQRDERENIAKAAALLTRQITEDRLIYVFGVGGHSVIGAEEMFWRAGGLANVSPLFDATLQLSGGGRKSTMIERVPGVGDKVIAAANLGADDVLIITSIYGMNAATIDAAMEAKRRGVTVIAITSLDHARKTPADFPARHPSRENLFDLADVVIDNHVPYGDALVEVPGCPQRVGACSTMLVSACIQWLIIATVRHCGEMGEAAPIWQSANTTGGDEANAALMQRFLSRVKAL